MPKTLRGAPIGIGTVVGPDGSTFDVVQDEELPPVSIPQVRRGMVVRVKYLPEDESDVAVLTTLV